MRHGDMVVYPTFEVRLESDLNTQSELVVLFKGKRKSAMCCVSPRFDAPHR